MVVDDILDGYVTTTAAEVEYGLRFAKIGLAVDETATQRARAELAKVSAA